MDYTLEGERRMGGGGGGGGGREVEGIKKDKRGDNDRRFEQRKCTLRLSSNN